MIDDLFAQLAIDAVDRLLSPETSRDEADFGLARLSSRLSPRHRREEVEAGRDWPRDSAPELEARLLTQYLQLAVDDLQQVSSRVHEWLLDRVSHGRATLSVDDLRTLTALYFLFPESTVRHSVVGLMVQADSHREGTNVDGQDAALSPIWDSIDRDEGLAFEDRVDQFRLLADLLLDYIDVFPRATERTLTALYDGHQYEALTAHLVDWSGRLGGEPGARVRRAIEKSDRPR